jgi:hypothetical protein
LRRAERRIRVDLRAGDRHSFHSSRHLTLHPRLCRCAGRCGDGSRVVGRVGASRRSRLVTSRVVGWVIAGGASVGAAIGNTAIWLSMPNVARSQWQYCHSAPKDPRPQSQGFESRLSTSRFRHHQPLATNH